MSSFRLSACMLRQLVLVVSLSASSAVAGVIEVRVRDAITHYAVEATVKLEGPESLVFSTDRRGRVKREVKPGVYREEYSAPGYKTMRSNTNIESGKITPLGAYLQPETPPEELRPEILQSKMRSGYTLLHEYVVDGETGEPLAGVRVHLVNANAETRTNSRGYFWLSVPTPPAPIPGGFGTDTLVYEKAGYKTLTLRNFGIDSEEIGGIAIDLEKGSGRIDLDVTHKMMRDQAEEVKKPHPAREEEMPSVRASSSELHDAIGPRGHSLSTESASRVQVSAVTVPSTIKVGHNCTLVNRRIVCTTWDPPIALEEYVTKGLSAEWPRLWHPESLKAGAVAYRTYGAYYVANPISTNYDICDNTMCQVYNPNGWPSNAAIRAAVSATVGIVMTRDNIIFKSEYAAESNDSDQLDGAGNRLNTCGQGKVGEPTQNWPCMKDHVCTGKKQASTHSRGMCQRGSQRWASGKDATGAPGDTGASITTPRDWRCILDHYYNANSNSITVEPDAVQYPGGTAGTLNRRGFLQGAPAYGSIAYADHSTSPTSIRSAVAADGSGDRRLAAGVYPSWAPDGLAVVYSSGLGLWVMNPDGTGQTQLTTNSGVDQYGNTKIDFNPAWSPLGDKIAFCSTRSAIGVDIWMINIDGTGLTQITQGLFDYGMGTGPQPCYLAWSANGTKLAFTGDTVTGPWPRLRYDVYTINVNGSAVTQLTSCQVTNEYQSACYNPSWSPNGKIIAFEDGNYQGDNLGGAGIYAMNADGTGITGIHLSNSIINRFPHWSTDGQKMFFLSNQGAKWGIWSMNPDNTGVMQLVGAPNSYKFDPGQFDCSRCKRFDQ